MGQIIICGQVLLSSTGRPVDRCFVVLASVRKSDGGILNHPNILGVTTGDNGIFEFGFPISGDHYGDLADSYIRISVTDHRDGGISQETHRFSSRTTTHPLIPLPNIVNSRDFDITAMFNNYSARERVISSSFGRDRAVEFINNTPFARFGPLCQRAFNLFNGTRAFVPGASPFPENTNYLSIPFIRVS